MAEVEENVTIIELARRCNSGRVQIMITKTNMEFQPFPLGADWEPVDKLTAVKGTGSNKRYRVLWPGGRSMWEKEADVSQKLLGEFYKTRTKAGKIHKNRWLIKL
jgi:hypothetical protein